MSDLAAILQYEPECVFLDFKGSEYKKDITSKGKKEHYEDFIKDVMSMANAHYDGDRFIIIGVSFQDGIRVLKGIESMIDAATFQQIIHANIEPDISLSYEPFLFEGKTFGVFRIIDCDDRPYLMKKDFGSLKRGEGYIRKGSFQLRLDRADYDKMGEQRFNRQYFTEEIELVFGSTHKTSMTLEVPREFNLPSEVIKGQMQKALDIKQRYKKTMTREILNMPFFFKSIEDLEKDMLTTGKDYLKADLHYAFELQAKKFSLEITNLGAEYMTDAYIKVFIPKVDGLKVADRIYHRMNYDSIAGLGFFNGPNMDLLNYPTVVETNRDFCVGSKLGDVKHLLTQVIFHEPVRLALTPRLIGTSVEMKCCIFAQNLKKPVEKILRLEFV